MVAAKVLWHYGANYFLTLSINLDLMGVMHNKLCPPCMTRVWIPLVNVVTYLSAASLSHSLGMLSLHPLFLNIVFINFWIILYFVIFYTLVV